MNRETERTECHEYFKQLGLDEELRIKLASLIPLGDAHREIKQEITFISAQSDTLPVLRKEKKNA